MSRVDTILDLIDDTLAAESVALEAIQAAANAISVEEELAHLTAAEDLLEQASKNRRAVDEFWAGVKVWSWGDDDIVTAFIPDDTQPRGSLAWAGA